MAETAVAAPPREAQARVVRRAREARASGEATRRSAREARRRALETLARARRTRRKVVGAVFAMAVEDPLAVGGFWSKGVPVPAPTASVDDAWATTVLLELDAEGRITACAGGAPVWVTGFDGDGLVGRHFSVLYDADAADNHQPERDLSAALASSGYSEQGWRRRADGSRFWASVSLVPRYGHRGQVVGYTAMVRDESGAMTTDRRRDGAGPAAPAPEARDGAVEVTVAAELAANVVNRLFAVGLSLYSARSRTAQPAVAEKIDEAVALVDDTIRYIRLALWHQGTGGREGP